MSITSNKQLKQYYNEKITGLMERTPLCRHFGECGGCSWQHLNYNTQIRLKTDALREIMSSVTGGAIAVMPSPEEYNYRARMDYVCSHDPFHPPLDRLGLRKKKQFNYVIDLQECHLIDPQLFSHIHAVFAEAKNLEIPLYDLVSGKGELRYLVTRTSGAQSMLIIITRSQEQAQAIAQLAEFAISRKFTSIYWVEQGSVADVSFGDVVKYWGDEYLGMQVGLDRVINLQIGPNNFFQNNIPQFNQLLHYVAAQLQENTLLLDLYCGVGTIGISLANKFAHVIGVEVEQSSIAMAERNARANNVTNIEFYAGDVSNLKSEVPKARAADHTTVIVDPPRAGLTPKGVAEVLELQPQELIYISCNPITQAQDLPLLLTQYKLESIQGFDMFPQTQHMESVAVLRRLDV